MPALVEVVAFAPVHGTYTYRVPEELQHLVQPGCRVLVPFGAKQLMGVVLAAVDREPGQIAIKPIDDVLDAEPVLPAALVQLLMWIASYYISPPGEVVRAALPAALHAPQRQQLRITEEGRRVMAAQSAVLRSESDDLNERQRGMLQQLSQASRGTMSLRSLQGSAGQSRALLGLLERQLVVQVMHRKGVGRFRTELELTLTDLARDPAALPGRAKKQLALLQTLHAMGGRARMSRLRDELGATAQLARRLADRGLVRLEQVEVPLDPFAAEPVELERELTLTREQEAVLEPLMQAAAAGQFAGFLLHGVTGSGKTEVYLRLIADVMQRGGDAIVLVPEISLTPQLAARFRARFGEQVAVLHSGLTDAERFGQWRLIRGGRVRIVVGARSAIFAPVTRLGVVIVDEEHDGSFKQEEGVRYNARDVALVRAKGAQAVAVLGSATPSLESYFGARQGRLTLLQMRKRATPRPLPEVQVVDLRRYQTGPEGFLSAPLAQALTEVLQRQEQAILFLNRRGFASFMLCRLCGYVFRCTNCSVSLTYHRSLERIICHYCGFARAVPTSCPTCSGTAVIQMGMGTEQLEQGLRLRFPQARLGRLDRDTAAGKGLRRILRQVTRHEIDILVGTQMVTKGHDFPRVTLVGVISADMGLHFPDFRSSERTFQLLTQVAGRAGRGEQPGRVVIQTYDPEHASIHHAQNHDYEAFYDHEVASRRELLYPPWGHLVALRVDGRDPAVVEQAARRLGDAAHRLTSPAAKVVVLGPAEAPIQRLKGRTRWLLLLKAERRSDLRACVEALLRHTDVAGVRVTVDVDPLMML